MAVDKDKAYRYAKEYMAKKKKLAKDKPTPQTANLYPGTQETVLPLAKPDAPQFKDLATTSIQQGMIVPEPEPTIPAPGPMPMLPLAKDLSRMTDPTVSPEVAPGISLARAKQALAAGRAVGPQPQMSGVSRPVNPEVTAIQGELNTLQNPPQMSGKMALLKSILAGLQGLTMDPAQKWQMDMAQKAQEEQATRQRMDTLYRRAKDITEQERQQEQDAYTRDDREFEEKLRPLKFRKAEADVAAAEAQLTRQPERTFEPVTVSTRSGGTVRANYDKHSGRYFDAQNNDISAEVADVYRPTTEQRKPYPQLQAELIEQAYAEKIRKPVEQLTATERVQAQQWHAAMTPQQRTEFDKRLALYEKDPKKYNALYGRDDDETLKPSQIAAVVQRIITASKDGLTGEINPAVYENQRQIFSRILGTELPRYGEAIQQQQQSGGSGDLSDLGPMRRRYSVGEAILGSDGTTYQITGFDEEGQPIGVPIHEPATRGRR